MPAGMHVPIRRREVESGRLVDGQSVHIPAQEHRRAGERSAQDGYDRAELLTERDLKRQPF